MSGAPAEEGQQLSGAPAEAGQQLSAAEDGAEETQQPSAVSSPVGKEEQFIEELQLCFNQVGDGAEYLNPAQLTQLFEMVDWTSTSPPSELWACLDSTALRPKLTLQVGDTQAARDHCPMGAHLLGSAP